MMKTIKRLNTIADSRIEQEKASQEEVVALLRRWAWMNTARGFMAMARGLTGVWAIVKGQK